eukprot:ANDGO_01588.mRNA.1 hypothetical protein
MPLYRGEFGTLLSYDLDAVRSVSALYRLAASLTKASSAQQVLMLTQGMDVRSFFTGATTAAGTTSSGGNPQSQQSQQSQQAQQAPHLESYSSTSFEWADGAVGISSTSAASSPASSLLHSHMAGSTSMMSGSIASSGSGEVRVSASQNVYAFSFDASLTKPVMDAMFHDLQRDWTDFEQSIVDKRARIASEEPNYAAILTGAPQDGAAAATSGAPSMDEVYARMDPGDVVIVKTLVTYAKSFFRDWKVAELEAARSQRVFKFFNVLIHQSEAVHQLAAFLDERYGKADRECAADLRRAQKRLDAYLDKMPENQIARFREETSRFRALHEALRSETSASHAFSFIPRNSSHAGSAVGGSSAGTSTGGSAERYNTVIGGGFSAASLSMMVDEDFRRITALNERFCSIAEAFQRDFSEVHGRILATVNGAGSVSSRDDPLVEYVVAIRQREETHRQTVHMMQTGTLAAQSKELLGLRDWIARWYEMALHVVNVCMKDVVRRLRVVEKIRGQSKILRTFCTSLDEKFLRLQWEQEQTRRAGMDQWFQEQQQRLGVQLFTTAEERTQTSDVEVASVGLQASLDEEFPTPLCEMAVECVDLLRVPVPKITAESAAQNKPDVADDAMQTDEMRELREFARTRRERGECIEQVAVLVGKLEETKIAKKELSRRVRELEARLRTLDPSASSSALPPGSHST